MRSGELLRSESGAVTSDWVVLTAGIALFGAALAISIMENSSGYLMDEMEILNERYARDAVTVSKLDQEREPGAERAFDD